MMKKITKVAFAIALGLGITGSGLFTHSASAESERIFNPTTGQWEKVTHRPVHLRKPHRKYKRKTVPIRTKLAPGTLVIHTDKKFLYYVESATKATRYGVGVGKEGFGWSGEVAVRRKAEWPAWTPPKEMIERERAEGRELPARMEGGPENPLGARALYLYEGKADTLYRIHGTHQPWSIGLNLSSGCIRLLNKDVEHLYNRVKIGAKVKVVGPGEKVSKYMTEITNPLAALFAGNG